MLRRVRIGSGSSYWGDMLDPAVELAEKGDIQYMGFDHLAELTMSILQRQKAKDPTKGYIQDIIPFMKALLPIAHRKGIKLITNAGGVNPEAAGEAVARVARDLGLTGIKIATVSGDDLLPQLDSLMEQGVPFVNLDNGRSDLAALRDRVVAANAYVGADGIVEALRQGADVVICGRCSDTAVYVGPLMYEFGWEYSQPYWDRIAAAITAGHVVECAENVCGAMSNLWETVPNLARVGFPFFDFYEDGTFEVSKVPGSGGVINEWTVKEQLTYEIIDPKKYTMPDGVPDFTSIKIEQVGPDRVRFSEITGAPRPETLKVQVGYADGYIGEGQVLFSWPKALEKARKAEQIVRGRFEAVGLRADEVRFDYLGVNTLHGHLSPEPEYDPNEVGLRIVARCRSKEEADKVRREATHLWTLGGVGSAFGVPFAPRPVISLWPTLVPRDAIQLKVAVSEVR